MQRFELVAETRTRTGKGVARKLRRDGKIPAILYGGGRDARPLSLERRRLSVLLSRHEGHHMLVDLTVEGEGGEKTLTVIQDLEIDPLNRVILHADFLRVDPTKPIHTEVPVHLVGLSRGVKEGGTLQQLLREVEIKALPTAMPEHVEADITNLGIGESLHVGDIIASDASYEIVTESDRVICTISAPRVQAERGAARVAEDEGGEKTGAAESEDSGKTEQEGQ